MFNRMSNAKRRNITTQQENDIASLQMTFQHSEFSALLQDIRNFGRFPSKKPADDEEKELFHRFRTIKNRGLTTQEEDDLASLQTTFQHSEFSLLLQDIRNFGRCPSKKPADDEEKSCRIGSEPSRPEV